MSDEFDEVMRQAGGEGAFRPEGGEKLRKLELMAGDAQLFYSSRTMEPTKIHLHVQFRYGNEPRGKPFPVECDRRWFHIQSRHQDETGRNISEWLAILLDVEQAEDLVDLLTHEIEKVRGEAAEE